MVETCPLFYDWQTHIAPWHPQLCWQLSDQVLFMNLWSAGYKNSTQPTNIEIQNCPVRYLGRIKYKSMHSSRFWTLCSGVFSLSLYQLFSRVPAISIPCRASLLVLAQGSPSESVFRIKSARVDFASHSLKPLGSLEGGWGIDSIPCQVWLWVLWVLWPMLCNRCVWSIWNVRTIPGGDVGWTTCELLRSSGGEHHSRCSALAWGRLFVEGLRLAHLVITSPLIEGKACF